MSTVGHNVYRDMGLLLKKILLYGGRKIERFGNGERYISLRREEGDGGVVARELGACACC